MGILRVVTPLVVLATPLISEFTTVIWSKFHLRNLLFTLGNTNVFLEITPLGILFPVDNIDYMTLHSVSFCKKGAKNKYPAGFVLKLTLASNDVIFHIPHIFLDAPKIDNFFTKKL